MDLIASDGNYFVDGLEPIERLTVATLKSGSEWSEEKHMRCLVCGYEYMHIVTSGVHQNDTLHLIASDGVHIVRGMPSLGRGSAVVTIYSCEADHTFAVTQRFHKGNVFLGVVQLPAKFLDLPTLWRD